MNVVLMGPAGTRHQSARPAARGHYILHSPQDELADSPDHNRQRNFEILLAYEITTPHQADFGRVQSDLDIVEKGAVALQIKNPEAESTNPRAAGIPREKRANVGHPRLSYTGNTEPCLICCSDPGPWPSPTIAYTSASIRKNWMTSLPRAASFPPNHLPFSIIPVANSC